MVALLNAKLPATKSSPTNSIIFIETLPGHGVLTIRQKRLDSRYSVSEFACDGGRGFRLEKLDAGSDATEDAYEVFVKDGQSGEYSRCCCKGFERFGNCKHVESAQALADRWNCRKPVAPAKKPWVSADPGADQNVF